VTGRAKTSTATAVSKVYYWIGD